MFFPLVGYCLKSATYKSILIICVMIWEIKEWKINLSIEKN